MKRATITLPDELEQTLADRGLSVVPAYPVSREATALVGRYPDQSITLFYATLAVVTLRMGLAVWTYDHHLDTMQGAIWR